MFLVGDGIDYNTREGRLTANMLSVIADDYCRNLRKAALMGINERLAQGLYPFCAPIGYLNNGRGKPKTIDPVTGPYILKIFELYATGEYSLDGLVKEAKSRNFVNRSGNPITRNCIERTLVNPFYTGMIYIKCRGETYSGIHEPLISTKLFKQVESVRANRHHKKDTHHKFLFRGLFKCAECIRTLTAERQYKYVYYRCHNKECSVTTIREDRIEHLINAAFSKLSLSAKAIGKLENHLDQWLNEKTKAETVNPIPMQLELIKQQKSQTTDDLIDGVIDNKTSQQKLNRLCEREIVLVDKQQNQVDKTLKVDAIKKMFEILKNPYFTYDLGDDSEKRQMLKIMSSKLLLDREKLYFEP